MSEAEKALKEIALALDPHYSEGGDVVWLAKNYIKNIAEHTENIESQLAAEKKAREEAEAKLKISRIVEGGANDAADLYIKELEGKLEQSESGAAFYRKALCDAKIAYGEPGGPMSPMEAEVYGIIRDALTRCLVGKAYAEEMEAAETLCKFFIAKMSMLDEKFCEQALKLTENWRAAKARRQA